MDLDEVDRRLLAALLEDASRSLRELAEIAGVSAPTVSSRIDRLEELGLIGPSRREVDLSRLGELVLVTVASEDVEELAEHPRVFRVYRTPGDRSVALALFEDEAGLADLRDRFPGVEIERLTEQIHASTPPFTGPSVRTACAACGRPIEGDQGREVRMGGRRVVACCPTCEQVLANEGLDPEAVASSSARVGGPIPRFEEGICDQCGASVEDADDAIEVDLGGKTYVVCCPNCREALVARYERHEGAA